MKLLSKPYHCFVGETYDFVLFYNYIVHMQIDNSILKKYGIKGR